MRSAADDIPAVIDVEASGLGRASYPIEVGYVLPDGRRFCSLIRPQEGWQHWDPEAERLHGISRHQTLHFGRDALSVCSRLDQDLRGRVVYTDAWAHDWPWLMRLYDAVERSPPYRLESVRTLLDEAQLADWHPTLEAVRAELARGRHRASADAAAVQAALCRMKGIVRADRTAPGQTAGQRRMP